MKNCTFHHVVPNCGTVTLEREFSRTLGFRQNVPTLMLHDFKRKKIYINDLDFPSNWKTYKKSDFSLDLTLNLGMFRPVTPERQFCWTCGFRRIVPDIILHDYKVFWEKNKHKIFLEMRKTVKKWHRFWQSSKAICRLKGRKYQKSVWTRKFLQTFIFMKIESDFNLDRPLRR